jgi:hypothetical protein
MCIYSAIHGAHRTQFHHRKASFFILTDRTVGVDSAYILRCLRNQGKGVCAKQKALAKKLNVLLPSSIKKDSLIDKILTRPVDGRSEQRAIQDIS